MSDNNVSIAVFLLESVYLSTVVPYGGIIILLLVIYADYMHPEVGITCAYFYIILVILICV